MIGLEKVLSFEFGKLELQSMFNINLINNLNTFLQRILRLEMVVYD